MVQHDQLLEYIVRNFEELFHEKPISIEKNIQHFSTLDDTLVVCETDIEGTTDSSYYIIEVKDPDFTLEDYVRADKKAEKQLGRLLRHNGYEDKNLFMLYAVGKAEPEEFMVYYKLYRRRLN